MGEKIVYMQRVDSPDRFFHCTAYAADISEASCAGNWRDARNPAIERNFSCRGCPIGALHAGEPDDASAYLGARLCPRHRGPGSRLILKGELCVSCYNRQMEAFSGRLYGSKGEAGGVPVKTTARRLRPRSVAMHDGERIVINRRPWAVDAIEVVFSVLRSYKRHVVFGFLSSPRPRRARA